jgi:DNA (cytosine-5)-methyltransferase 1
MDDVDLITYGFPCQDISAAGKQRGFEDKDGNRTRSGLFFEALRIIEETRPLYAIAENVKALTSKKFEKEFKTVLDSLDGAGYNNYWAVLNAKDYGIPQNRERVFIVSIRKDIDKGGFKFPEKMPLNIRVKDILENNVDEKYYINTEKARQLIKKLLDKNRITGVEVCDATVNAPNVRSGYIQRHY